jgi:uncharacterized membrane protein YqaE (UPF0057 family)
MKQFTKFSIWFSFAVVLLMSNANLYAINSGKVNLSQEDRILAHELDIKTIDEFLNLTPALYKEKTGKKLSIKQIVQLKAAQKMIKHELKKTNMEDFPKGAYILLVILGWGFIPLGILSDWEGNDWWINFLLTCLCWLPGVIHGLAVMKKYYK